MMSRTSCKITLSNTFCGATAVFEYRRNDRLWMQNARYIQLIQLRLTSTIVKWQMCNMHERKKMMVII